MATELTISGMSCQHCVGAVTRALESVPGVIAVRVELDSAIARVEGDADTAALIRAVVEAGYGAEPSASG